MQRSLFRANRAASLSRQAFRPVAVTRTSLASLVAAAGATFATLPLNAAQAVVAPLIAVRSQPASPPLKVYRVLHEAGN
jgi:hypothetical protein